MVAGLAATDLIFPPLAPAHVVGKSWLPLALLSTLFFGGAATVIALSIWIARLIVAHPFIRPAAAYIIFCVLVTAHLLAVYLLGHGSPPADDPDNGPDKGMLLLLAASYVSGLAVAVAAIGLQMLVAIWRLISVRAKRAA